jgi:hypothetical protein
MCLLVTHSYRRYDMTKSVDATFVAGALPYTPAVAALLRDPRPLAEVVRDLRALAKKEAGD